MNKTILLTASALAILAAVPAFAANDANNNADKPAESTTQGVKQDMKEGWQDTKEAVSNAAEKTSDAASDAYENIKATFIADEENVSASTVTIDKRQTASGMIGQPVENTSGEKIASIHDIILDGEGNAQTVVLADGGFMGIGTKLAAFDYNLISQRQKDGDVIMPISEETLDKVAPFSYDAKDAEKDAKVRVIPANGISVAELLKGQILNAKKENVAEIDNISFSNGEANQIIIGFDKTLGLGGEKAAMSFDNANVIRQKNDIDVQLSAAQATNFENFKKSNTN